MIENFIEVHSAESTLLVAVPHITAVAKHIDLHTGEEHGTEVYLDDYNKTPILTIESYESIVSKIKESENK